MKILATLISLFFVSFSYGQLNVELLSQVNYTSSGNDVWGYTAPNGDEYAIMGLRNGVSIVDITDPRNPVEAQFIDQVSTGWRDIKTWDQFIYVTSESSGNGLLVVDMRNVTDSITWENLFLPVPTGETVNSCHNIYIDEFGFAYLAGCNPGVGGVEIFDLRTTPSVPEFAGRIDIEYSHDVYVRDNRVYSSEINAGHFAIYDVEDKSNPFLVATQTTPFAFTHNTWLSDNGEVLFTTDERGNAPVAAYDISDPDNIQLLDEFRPLATMGTGVSPHNVHVWEDWLIVSYYTDGCIIVDASVPDNMIEVGNFDTFLQAGAGFGGAWGAFPYFDSGTILIGDTQGGLFIVGPTYRRASRIEGLVTDATTGEPINGATITINEAPIEAFSNITGEYKSGHITEGTFEMTVSRNGYETQTRIVTLENGVQTVENFQLVSRGRFNLRGNIVDAVTSLPIENAQVRIDFEGDIRTLRTNGDGNFAVDNLIAGTYDIVVGSWGHEYLFLNDQAFEQDGAVESVSLMLNPGYEDVFSLDLGWESTLNGMQGQWFRTIPVGASPPGFPINAAPDGDSEDEGARAFVTGVQTDFFGGLLIGETNLTSPPFDGLSMERPVMTFDFWHFALDQNTNSVDAPIVVCVNNGELVEFIDTISIPLNQLTFEWMPSREYVLEDYISLTSNMTVNLFMNNTDANAAVEGGFDNWRLFDDPESSVEEVISNDFKVYPNPASDYFTIEIPVEFQTSNSTMTLRDMNGRMIARRNLVSESLITLGESLSNGIYFIQLSDKERISQRIKLIKTN